MFNPTELQPLPRNQEREALGAMGGYDYQIWRSIESWLSLQPDEVLFLEGAEDIDRVSPAETVTVQVKRRQESLSLNSGSARDAIANFWVTSKRSPDRLISFVYLTTGDLALERNAQFDGLTGIQAWAKAEFDSSLAEAVRRQLLESLNAEHPIWELLVSATTEELQEQLFSRFKWLMQQPNVDVVEQSVLDRIGDLLEKRQQPRSAATVVKTALFAFCWKQVLKELPAQRRLDTELLDTQLILATTVTLELPVGSAAGLVMAAAQLPMLQGLATNLALLQDQPPAPPRMLLKRLELVERVIRTVKQRTPLLLAGSVFMGKTTIAQVVARDCGLSTSWTELSQRPPAAVAEIFKLLAMTLDRPGGPDLLILDDLDTSASARRTYTKSLRQLLHRAEVTGKALLFTAQGHSEALEREVADSWGIEIFQVPQMQAEEIMEHCRDRGCPDEHSDGWGRLVYMQSSGHPALVQVRLNEIAATDWVHAKGAELLGATQATRSVKQQARDLISTAYSPAEVQFALEAGEFLVRPTRKMLLNLAGMPPPLAGASIVISKLTGRWIEELDNDRFRVTQVLRGELDITWTESQYRDIHRKIYDAIVATKSLSPADGASTAYHAFVARDTERFNRSCFIILGAEAPIKSQVLMHSIWVLGIETKPSPVIDALDAQLPTLRQLQFIVTVAEDPDRVDGVARAWRRAVSHQANTAWRSMYDVTLLSTHVRLSIELVLDAISSLMLAPSELRHMLDAGLAKLQEQEEMQVLAPPKDATPLQVLLSFHAGGVQTTKDLETLVHWLEVPENSDYAKEFDAIFEWPYVSQVGGFVHMGWMNEAQKEEPDWSGWLTMLDVGLQSCTRLGLRNYAAELTRAKSIILDEYILDHEAAVSVIANAELSFGMNPVLEEQRVNILWRAGRHEDALKAWEQLGDKIAAHYAFGVFAWRRAAISAGMTKQYSRAVQLFEAALSRVGEMSQVTSVGLMADAAYCAFRAKDRRRCIHFLARAVSALPAEARSDGAQDWEAVVQACNTIIQVVMVTNARNIDGSLLPISIGMASTPGIKIERSEPGQALRVECFAAQVALLESEWKDANPQVVERSWQLLSSPYPLVRLYAEASVIMRALVQRQSVRIEQALGLVRAMQATENDANLSDDVSLGLILTGLLALYLLLNEREPLEQLTEWEAGAEALASTPLKAVLAKLRVGVSLTPHEAATEVKTNRSRDKSICFGAAIRVCWSDDVGMAALSMAGIRIAGALKSGILLLFNEGFRVLLTRYLAKRFTRQLRLPAQFVLPTLTLPALNEVIRDVGRGTADLKELLATGCKAAGVNVGDALDAI